MNPDIKYSVYYSGELLPGFDLKKSVVLLHSNMGLSADEIRHIVTNGSKELKKDISIDVAIEITRKLVFCGLYCFYKPYERANSQTSEIKNIGKTPLDEMHGIVTKKIKDKLKIPLAQRIKDEWKTSSRQRKAVTIIIGVVGLFLVLFGVPGMGGDINVIKGSTMKVCSSKTVGKMVDGLFHRPKWTSGTAQRGNVKRKFVNVEGEITVAGNPTRAKIQFLFSPDGSQFEVQAVEFNGTPQNNLVKMNLLNTMCQN